MNASCVATYPCLKQGDLEANLPSNPRIELRKTPLPELTPEAPPREDPRRDARAGPGGPGVRPHRSKIAPSENFPELTPPGASQRGAGGCESNGGVKRRRRKQQREAAGGAVAAAGATVAEATQAGAMAGESKGGAAAEKQLQCWGNHSAIARARRGRRSCQRRAIASHPAVRRGAPRAGALLRRPLRAAAPRARARGGEPPAPGARGAAGLSGGVADGPPAAEGGVGAHAREYAAGRPSELRDPAAEDWGGGGRLRSLLPHRSAREPAGSPNFDILAGQGSSRLTFGRELVLPARSQAKGSRAGLADLGQTARDLSTRFPRQRPEPEAHQCYSPNVSLELPF